MANPNLSTATAVYAVNAFVSITSTNATQILSNAAGSGKVFLLDSIVVANVDATNAADITINLYTGATITATAFRLASTIAVPADASLIVVSKDSTLCVNEDESVYAVASAADDLHVIASWKELS
jgi:hypothetical protein